jgi:prepilin-type N-terminal cleavage/methylation domain-containing protein
MNRRGFSMIEMLLVMVIIGIVGLIGLPRMRDTVDQANVRAARSHLANMVSTARSVAVSRGCPATFNLTTGAAGTVWITACQTSNVGAGGATETVGQVEPLAARYSVTITSTLNTFVFDRRGIRTDFNLTTIRVQSTRNAARIDSIQVNQVGKVIIR